jgi:LacI family transcriptional regulator
MRKKVSLAEVAAAAHVSPTTVSHVLSGKRPVNPETEQRIREAMRTLGYVPNYVAQSLARGSTHTIGLIVADISNPYFAELVKGTTEAANELEYNVVLANTAFNETREEQVLNQLVSGRLDGLIYGAGAPPSLQRLRAAIKNFPTVTVDESIDQLEVAAVVSDNYEGGRLMGKHLARLGHRSVLYLGGPLALATSHSRQKGLRDGLSSVCAGNKPEVKVHEVFANYQLEGGWEALQRELEIGRNWTAVFAGNDLMAVGAIQALLQAGLSVPGDVSVAGFDDTLAARLFKPRITTIRQPACDLGRVAAETLIMALEEGVPLVHKEVVLAVELVVGESTGPVAVEVHQPAEIHE